MYSCICVGGLDEFLAAAHLLQLVMHDHVLLCALGCHTSMRRVGALKILRRRENEPSPAKAAGYYLLRLFELI
jgi:hypothetical protein